MKKWSKLYLFFSFLSLIIFLSYHFSDNNSSKKITSIDSVKKDKKTLKLRDNKTDVKAHIVYKKKAYKEVYKNLRHDKNTQAISPGKNHKEQILRSFSSSEQKVFSINKWDKFLSRKSKEYKFNEGRLIKMNNLLAIRDKDQLSGKVILGQKGGYYIIEGKNAESSPTVLYDKDKKDIVVFTGKVIVKFVSSFEDIEKDNKDISKIREFKNLKLGFYKVEENSLSNLEKIIEKLKRNPKIHYVKLDLLDKAYEIN